MDFKSYIRDIENFPKAGVMFKDITPLLKDANALQKSTEALLDLIGDVKVDKVVGMESRGFFFAPLLASHLNAGFVPVRKPGKLPAKKMSQNYDLEYGTDSLEIHEDAIKKGEKVLVHDDVLATGGTAKATVDLIERNGAKVSALSFLVELEELKGRSKLEGRELFVTLRY